MMSEKQERRSQTMQLSEHRTPPEPGMVLVVEDDEDIAQLDAFVVTSNENKK